MDNNQLNLSVIVTRSLAASKEHPFVYGVQTVCQIG